jgi:prepilin signal peptidase PulO-like enzyme (type II secretory pathway)
MGFGDVKLLAMIGAFLGWQGALGTLMAASWLALIIGAPIVYLVPLFSKAKPDEDDTVSDDAAANVESESPIVESAPPLPASEFNAEAEEKRPSEYESDDGITLEGHYLPFGPFLVGGALLYLFFGPEVLAWYLDNRGNIL